MSAPTARISTLLVVDDNEANRDALSRRLANKGYFVRVAASGAEAIAMVAAGRFDLVLLDVEMPGMSGFDVLTTLRTTHSRTDLPVIMVTARTDGDDIVEAFRLGANDYVTKPIDFPVAVARIATHLAHKWAVSALRRAKSATRSPSTAPTMASGTGTSPPTRSTGRHAGRRCSATPRTS